MVAVFQARAAWGCIGSGLPMPPDRLEEELPLGTDRNRQMSAAAVVQEFKEDFFNAFVRLSDALEAE